MTARDLHALAIQLQLCGERGGTVPPDLLAKVGAALRLFANQAARMERTLDELVAEEQEAAARAERTARHNRIIQELLAQPGTASLSILKRETE